MLLFSELPTLKRNKSTFKSFTYQPSTQTYSGTEITVIMSANGFIKEFWQATIWLYQIPILRRKCLKTLWYQRKVFHPYSWPNADKRSITDLAHKIDFLIKKVLRGSWHIGFAKKPNILKKSNPVEKTSRENWGHWCLSFTQNKRALITCYFEVLLWDSKLFVLTFKFLIILGWDLQELLLDSVRSTP